MSRCRCCNNSLSRFDVPHYNPHTGEEDDLCTTCVYLAKNSVVEHEYVGGSHPVTGVTAPKQNFDQ